MPLRSELLTKRWSTVDLSLLQFLAHRVFKPWPCRARRVHTVPQATRVDPVTAGRVYNNRSQNDRQEGSPLGRGSSSILAEEEEWDGGFPSNEGIYNQDDKPRGLKTFRQFGNSDQEAGKTKDEPVNGSLEEEFQNKYKEIWGPQENKRNREDEELAPVRTVLVKPKQKFNGSISLTLNTPVIKHDYRSQHTILKKLSLRSSKLNRHLIVAQREKDIHIRLLDQREIHRLGIARVRTKWVSTTPEAGYNSAPSSRFWHRNFAILNLRHQKFARRVARPRFVAKGGFRFSQISKRELIQLPSRALREKWESLHQDLRIQMWPELMITALNHYPTEALKFLATTYNDPLPPMYAVSDSIEYIISHYLTAVGDSKMDFALNLQKKVTLLLRHKPEHRLRITQKSIFLLMSNLDDEHMKGLYKDLTELEQPLHSNTLIQFASRLAKSGEVDLGFEALKELSLKKVNFTTDRMMSLCSSLLFHSHGALGSSSSNSERFQFMLFHGIAPNTITYNILIQNALQAGDPETAWQMHGLMLENGVEPDGYTYSILLNDAKLRMDPSAIRSIIGYLKEKDIKSPHVVTDVLHTILLLHQQEKQDSEAPLGLREKRQSAFERVLDVYCEHFDVKPLARLIPEFRERYPSARGPSSSRRSGTDAVYPPRPALAVMISGLFDGLDSQATKDLYDHFCQLMLSGEPCVLDLMSSTYVWNIFLLAFGRFPDRLFDCPKVIGKMISGRVKFVPTPLVEDFDRHASPPAQRRGRSSEPSAMSALDPKDHDVSSQNTPKHVDFEDTEFPSLQSDQPYYQSNYQGRSRPRTPTIRYTKKRWQPLVSRSNPPVRFTYPQPDIYTWSILLKIFTDHGQTRAAEKVISAMQARNITPNQVTWNTLAHGYSRMQDAEMVADTVSRMENAGFEPNEITMNALSRIRNRRRLMDAVRKKQNEAARKKENEVDVQELDKGFVKGLTMRLLQDQEEEEAYIRRKLAAESKE